MQAPVAGVTFKRWSLALAFRLVRTTSAFAAFFASLVHLSPSDVRSPAMPAPRPSRPCPYRHSPGCLCDHCHPVLPTREWQAGPRSEDFEVVSATRRTSELVAPFGEVSVQTAALSPSCDPYGPASPGIKKPPSPPYRSPDASRLKLMVGG